MFLDRIEFRAAKICRIKTLGIVSRRQSRKLSKFIDGNICWNDSIDVKTGDVFLNLDMPVSLKLNRNESLYLVVTRTCFNASWAIPVYERQHELMGNVFLHSSGQQVWIADMDYGFYEEVKFLP